MKFVEATMVMPLAVIITVSLIGLMMTFYNHHLDQLREIEQARSEIYESREVTYIRTYDRLEYGFAE